MTYVRPDFNTKKALHEAVNQGQQVIVYEPGMGSVPDNGTVYLEGPHYPKPHRWYAKGTMKNGILIKVS
jgi:hypothetical protein